MQSILPTNCYNKFFGESPFQVPLRIDKDHYKIFPPADENEIPFLTSITFYVQHVVTRLHNKVMMSDLDGSLKFSAVTLLAASTYLIGLASIIETVIRLSVALLIELTIPDRLPQSFQNYIQLGALASLFITTHSLLTVPQILLSKNLFIYMPNDIRHFL